MLFTPRLSHFEPGLGLVGRLYRFLTCRQPSRPVSLLQAHVFSSLFPPQIASSLAFFRCPSPSHTSPYILTYIPIHIPAASPPDQIQYPLSRPAVKRCGCRLFSDGGIRSSGRAEKACRCGAAFISGASYYQRGRIFQAIFLLIPIPFLLIAFENSSSPATTTTITFIQRPLCCRFALPVIAIALACLSACT